MTNNEMAELANDLVDNLHKLAEAIDPAYYEECAQSGCTNAEPLNDTFRLLRHLVATAGTINASGLCDLNDETGEILEWVICHPFMPLEYQWHI
jgi:hypothetical protein